MRLPDLGRLASSTAGESGVTRSPTFLHLDAAVDAKKPGPPSALDPSSGPSEEAALALDREPRSDPPRLESEGAVSSLRKPLRLPPPPLRAMVWLSWAGLGYDGSGLRFGGADFGLGGTVSSASCAGDRDRTTLGSLGDRDVSLGDRDRAPEVSLGDRVGMREGLCARSGGERERPVEAGSDECGAVDGQFPHPPQALQLHSRFGAAVTGCHECCVESPRRFPLYALAPSLPRTDVPPPGAAPPRVALRAKHSVCLVLGEGRSAARLRTVFARVACAASGRALSKSLSVPESVSLCSPSPRRAAAMRVRGAEVSSRSNSASSQASTLCASPPRGVTLPSSNPSAASSPSTSLSRTPACCLRNLGRH
eukprot:CAMPEP_0114567212 /NCGR_PEP_ID=MMETSP0114-20121206/15348_1 /TAXON_ID=31324 /ORGANISM="Goniomonas sp, Strain m" /LENGTH=365 /DNA_ID=CAMNT_0001753761 /DNA_START=261 /DNA_END=1361 /DNA_ORIENTATION=-